MLARKQKLLLVSKWQYYKVGGMPCNGWPASLLAKIRLASMTCRPSTSRDTTPFPLVPLAVLPALLRYSDGSLGKSKRMTCPTISVSTPRDSLSVHTRTLSPSPLFKKSCTENTISSSRRCQYASAKAMSETLLLSDDSIGAKISMEGKISNQKQSELYRTAIHLQVISPAALLYGSMKWQNNGFGTHAPFQKILYLQIGKTSEVFYGRNHAAGSMNELKVMHIVNPYQELACRALLSTKCKCVLSVPLLIIQTLPCDKSPACCRKQ